MCLLEAIESPGLDPAPSGLSLRAGEGIPEKITPKEAEAGRIRRGNAPFSGSEVGGCLPRQNLSRAAGDSLTDDGLKIRRGTHKLCCGGHSQSRQLLFTNVMCQVDKGQVTWFPIRCLNCVTIIRYFEAALMPHALTLWLFCVKIILSIGLHSSQRSLQMCSRRVDAASSSQRCRMHAPAGTQSSARDPNC